MKVLSFNVGYFLGYRSQRDWFRRPHRAVLASRSTERTAFDATLDLVVEERPDVLALQEVDAGSLRSRLGPHPERVVDRAAEAGLDYQYRADCKYGPDRIVSKLPGTRHMSNMVCWRAGQASAHYVPPGVKQLVHVVDRPDDPNVVAVHLPTAAEERVTQLEKVAEIVRDHLPAVVVGDFNLFNGPDELAALTDRVEMTVHAPGETYPAADPEYAFDILLASPGVTVTRAEVVDSVTHFDHYPLVAEVEVA
jgi:endonuclease/exonuclease/phosphatase family metal-dependent hydrolase